MSVALTVALGGSSSGQGHWVLHGGGEARVATVGVAEPGAVDVQGVVLRGEGRGRQRIGGVSQGGRLPHAAASTTATSTATGGLLQRNLLILQEKQEVSP